MLPDDLLALVESIAQTSDAQYREQVIEAWIVSVASKISENTGNWLFPHGVGDPDVEKELSHCLPACRQRVAFQTGEVLKILLRKELLGK